MNQEDQHALGVCHPMRTKTANVFFWFLLCYMLV